jgi:hypothetical protein
MKGYLPDAFPSISIRRNSFTWGNVSIGTSKYGMVGRIRIEKSSHTQDQQQKTWILNSTE